MNAQNPIEGRAKPHAPTQQSNEMRGTLEYPRSIPLRRRIIAETLPPMLPMATSVPSASNAMDT